MHYIIKKDMAISQTDLVFEFYIKKNIKDCFIKRKTKLLQDKTTENSMVKFALSNNGQIF